MHFVAVFIAGLAMVSDAQCAATRRPSGVSAVRQVQSNKNANPGVAARAARVNTNTSNSTKSNVAPGSKPKGVAARAASTQQVISSGTKVNIAKDNNAVTVDCVQKYEGCMDAFCMLDNTSGGRCICSNKHAELNAILTSIDDMDNKSYKIATLGVDEVEMGLKSDLAISKANEVIKNLTEQNDEKGNKKKSRLDMSAWNPVASDDEEEEFGLASSQGDTLFVESSNLCRKKLSECAGDLDMLEKAYRRKIVADCNAFENSLKQQKNQSAQKLYAAQKAIRAAALDAIEASNKYNLGQCALEFKKCMITTAGCGEDFSKCASVVAIDHTNTISKKKVKTYKIKGPITTLEISASTYDTLMGKQPLCMGVTDNCVAVRDQVWDTFLQDVAPTLKTAELAAESNIRQNCVGTVSACFQKACKDNIDPKNPEGSYDMCLTRPTTMLNVCKVELNACGIDARSATTAQQSEIWQYVVQKLASLRVDSCTKQVKECLQSEDRCGPDYSNCVGLDLSAVRQMCPLDKLVGCRDHGSLESMDEIDNLIQGIYLNMDNALLTKCTDAAVAKMTEICGGVSSCNVWDNDTAIGTSSLTSRRDANGDYVIEGLVSFSNMVVKLDKQDNKNKDDVYSARYNITYNSDLYNGASNDVKKRINSAIDGLTEEVNRRISMLTTDPTISMCVTGRDMSQISGQKQKTKGRFPHLVDSYANIITNSILAVAKQNYDMKYSGLYLDAINASDTLKNTIMCNTMAFGDEVVKNHSALNNGKIPKISNTGIKSVTDYSIVISAAPDEDVYAAMAANTTKESVLLDKYESMIAKRTVRANYEPGTQTCIISTEVIPCTGSEAIYEGHSESESRSANVSLNVKAVGVGAGGSHETSQSATEFKGAFCRSYSEPVVSEQLISFAAGATHERLVTTRSNLTSQTIQNLTTTNTTNNSKSVSVGISADLDLSNVGNNNTKNKTKNKVNADSAPAAASGQDNSYEATHTGGSQKTGFKAIDNAAAKIDNAYNKMMDKANARYDARQQKKEQKALEKVQQKLNNNNGLGDNAPNLELLDLHHGEFLQK